MPRKAKELSAYQVRKLNRPGLHAVGGVDGLLLQVSAAGARSWILRVKVGDHRPDFGLGGYPDTNLEQARVRARETREQLRQGIDPRIARRAAQDALLAAYAKQLTFAEAAQRAYAAKAPEFRNPKHSAQWIRTLELYAFPTLGRLPVDSIELPHIVSALEPIWATKTETATRVRQRIEAVLSWATVAGFRKGDNPARWSGNLQYALPKASKLKKVEHHPAVPHAEIARFMAALRAREGIAARALEFTVLTAARAGEVRNATWDEIDLEQMLWTVPAERMKAGKTHRVPLSEAAVAVLRALPRTDNPLVFSNPGSGRALSGGALPKIMELMGYNAVPHGFRSSFKDWARSSTNYPDEVTELALAHVNSDSTRAAYARDELLPIRRRLMRDWAQHCADEAGTATADVVHIRG